MCSENKEEITGLSVSDCGHTAVVSVANTAKKNLRVQYNLENVFTSQFRKKDFV